MRIFKNKAFGRFAKSESITDAALRRAVADVGKGLIDADLGGGVLKLRMARTGGGKSGGFRTIVLYKRATLAFFVYGFAKSKTANLEADEVAAFKALAREMMALTNEQIEKLKATKHLVEVSDDG